MTTSVDRVTASDGRTYPKDRAALRAAIRAAIEADPEQTNTAIAKALNTSRDTVISVRASCDLHNFDAEPPTDPMLYQVMPPLADDEYSALRDDIEARGVLVPVEYDERGNILDGHHRVRACNELGLKTWPRFVRKGLTEDGKRPHARALNLARRHLTQRQRRDLIAQQLHETPKQSDNAIARALGVHHTTVNTIRKQGEATGDVAKLATRIDTKGREQPAAKPKRTADLSEHGAAIAHKLPEPVRAVAMPDHESPARKVDPNALHLCAMLRDFVKFLDDIDLQATMQAMPEHLIGDVRKHAPLVVSHLRRVA